MTALLDTNILIRHLTGDPPDQAARATRYLAVSDDLNLPDLILAEMIYVLESFYEVPIREVARLARSVITFPAISTDDPSRLLRAVEIYETHRVDFAEAYLVATAEATGINEIASFDKSIDKVPTVKRIQP